MNKPSDKKCRICGNSLNNKALLIREMQIGLAEEFEYFQCGNCKCIQIAEIPGDMSKYYSLGYYSFKTPKQIKNKLLKYLTIQVKKRLVEYYAGTFSLPGWVFSLFFDNPFPWYHKNLAGFDSRILDVGSGSGRLLNSMQRSGFTNLTGLDPFINETIEYQDNLIIYKKELHELKGEYDLIMLHHSLEHVENPLEILQCTSGILAPGGHVIIRIPLEGGYAWRHYREKWVQLDAPRHFFIHSVKSMEILCEEAGFQIESMVYDSSSLQFTGSEMYLQGIPLSSKTKVFSKREIKKYARDAIRLNQEKDGDAACFYLKRKQE